MILRALLAIAIVGILIYGVYEVRFWRTELGRTLVTGRQHVIRSLGLVLLLAGLGLWFGGTYIPVPQPKPGVHSRAARVAALRYIEYWTLTLCVMLPLIPLAILDTRENLKKAAAERNKLLAEQLALNRMASEAQEHEGGDE